MVKTALTNGIRLACGMCHGPGLTSSNTFNAWKKTEDAGRSWPFDSTAKPAMVTGSALAEFGCCVRQVFEEAAGTRGVAPWLAWSDSDAAKRQERGGFPRFRKENSRDTVVRMRNKPPQRPKPTFDSGRRTTAHLRSLCLESGRSPCMMTPARCGGHGATAGPSHMRTISQHAGGGGIPES